MTSDTTEHSEPGSGPGGSRGKFAVQEFNCFTSKIS